MKDFAHIFLNYFSPLSSQFLCHKYWLSVVLLCLVFLSPNFADYHWLQSEYSKTYVRSNFTYYSLLFRTFSDENDWREFILSLLHQFSAVFPYLAIFSAYCSCYIGFCTYLSALIIDFKLITSKLDKEITEMDNGNTTQLDTQQTINELIQLHVDILR